MIRNPPIMLMFSRLDSADEHMYSREESSSTARAAVHQCLCSNVLPHSDNRRSTRSHLPDFTSQLLVCLTHHHDFQTQNDTSHLPFSPSHGISREPPWPGLEGGVEGQEVAQGGGELHVEHHHTEGEMIYSRQTDGSTVLLQHEAFLFWLTSMHTSHTATTHWEEVRRCGWQLMLVLRHQLLSAFVMRSMHGGGLKANRHD